MYHVTFLKLNNSEFYRISDPKGFRKGTVDCAAHSILHMRKLRLGESSAFLKVKRLEGEPHMEMLKL